MSVIPLADQPAGRGTGGLYEPCVLLKLGEIVLKGRNRQHFERLLQDNIRRAVRDLGITIRIWQRDGVIVLRLADGEAGGASAEAMADLLAKRMRDVMGLARVCRAVRVA